MTISAATTAACAQAARARAAPDRARLYYRSFPATHVLLMERVAEWLVNQPNRFAGTSAFAHALLVLAEEAVTLRHIRDHVQVRWYPAGAYVVEQGEAATELYLVLSGAAEVWKEADGGQREHLAWLGVGEFFGELGVAGHRRRNADVLAAESLTCRGRRPHRLPSSWDAVEKFVSTSLSPTWQRTRPWATRPGKNNGRWWRVMYPSSSNGRSRPFVLIALSSRREPRHVPRVLTAGNFRLGVLRGGGQRFDP